MSKQQKPEQVTPEPVTKAPVPLPSGGGSYTVKGNRLDRREGTDAAPMRNSNKEG